MFPTTDTEDISQVTPLNRNTSPSRHERDSLEHTQVSKPNNNGELTLNMLIKEMVFCVALALTTYGALHNTPTKISKHPQAVKFFGPHSVVTDWYKGQLSHALDYVKKADVSFVMYYAPWDAESQYVREEFEKAAVVMNDRVHFSAVNCWNPGSECRLQYNKVPSFPILMVYTTSSRGILYRGPRQAHNIVRFLELIIKPLERVSSTEDLVGLLSICEAVAVGFTPLTETSKHYNIWYQVAVNSREFDVAGEVCFAAVTSEELASDLGVESVPSARLMTWNDTLEYKLEDGKDLWNESLLIKWALENFNQPVARIIPRWKKAFSFERYVDGNPLLILFTPLNPLYQQLPAYELLRDIATEYYSCKYNESTQWITELQKLQRVQRLIYEQKDHLKFCQEYKFKKLPRRTNIFLKKEVVAHNNKYPWSNTTQKTQKPGLFNFLVKRGLATSTTKTSEGSYDMLGPLNLQEECQNIAFPAEKSFYYDFEKCEQHEDNQEVDSDLNSHPELAKTSMLPLEDDPLAAENLIQENIKHFCDLTNFANERGPVVKPAKEDNDNMTHLHGLACANNFTLTMLAVDSVDNHHFAESLGIDIINKKDMTAVVILDTKHETQYVLSEEYGARSVREFIYNFTHKRLKRSLRTRVEDASHTHYYGSSGAAEQAGGSDSTAHLTDLTSKTFRKFVRTPGTVTLVGVCGGACPAQTARALLAAARLLRGCGVRARPARLDAARHDLPWHLAPHRYPTVLVFAAPSSSGGGGGGAADSAAYPAAARVSAAGLAALALRALALPQRVRVRLALCTNAASTTEKKTCLVEIKEHMTSTIGRNLEYWRRTDNQQVQTAFYKRLRSLHRVSLDLSLLHYSDLHDDNIKYNSLIDSLASLSKHWDIDNSILKNISIKS